MKISPKLTLLSSVAVLIASPVALGNEPEMVTCEVFPVAELPAAELVTPTLVECWVVPPGPLPTGEAIDVGGPALVGEGLVNEVTDEKIVTTEGEDMSINALVVGEVTEVPIDWIKRTDDGIPEMIFQNMAGAPSPAPTGAVATATQATEQGEQASTILVKDKSEAPQITHDKQGPVAVVKEGRVFLR